MTGKKIEWEHTIPLALRVYDPATGKYDPDEFDPRYLRPMTREDHRVKTFGTATPMTGDISVIAKNKRLAADQAAYRDRLLAKETGETPPAKKHRWHKRAFPKKPK